MADSPKPPDKPADKPVAVVPTSLVTVPQHVPIVPAERPETPPGGKFGVAEFVPGPDGKRTEKIKYVNAHGKPFSDDPNENMKDK